MRNNKVPLILACDVGNSFAKVGIFTSPHDSNALAKCWNWVVLPHESCGNVDFLTQHLSELLEEMGEHFPGHRSIQHAFVAGTAPHRIETMLSVWPTEDIPFPILFDSQSPFPFPIDVRFPYQVGIDRLLNAMGGNQLRKRNETLIVIDSGTATTIDLLDSNGSFAGGSILPGFQLGSKALHHYTEKLPLIELHEFDVTNPPVVGKETREAMKSGLYWGYIGAIREIVQRMVELPSENSSLRIVITGGGSPRIAPHFTKAEVKPHLTLQGLVALGLRQS